MIRFQVIIMLSIIGSSLFIGTNATKIVSIFWVCETILMVYSSWLLVHQLINIGASFLIGCLISKNKLH